MKRRWIKREDCYQADFRGRAIVLLFAIHGGMGAYISDIIAGSPAAETDLQPGDIITQIGSANRRKSSIPEYAV
ncbi:MAG: PDZ domain-containing protein [Bellilinea sp.]